MRSHLTSSPADHVVLVGSGAAALAALWRLCAAGARIRWYADRADLGEETVLAHALGRGRIELSFDDPRSASLDGVSALVVAGDGDVRLTERARASGVAVHHAEQIGLSGLEPGVRRSAAAAAAPA